MSSELRIRLSKAGSIAAILICFLATSAGVAFANTLPDICGTAEAVATMDVIQLLAYIAITSTGLTLFMVGIYVKSVTEAQNKAAAWMATIAKSQEGIAATLHDVSERCASKRCPS